jgi:hypothetical protein
MNHVHRAPNGDWYAVSSTAGAFRSTDQGMTWMRCGARLGDSIATTADGVVWMSGADVGRSTDNCATWTNTLNPRFSDYVFAEGMTVWALTDIGLRRWSGTSWVSIPTPLDNTRFLTMSKGPARYFIGTVDQGLMTSPDAITWTQAPLTAFQSPRVLGIAAGSAATYAITAGTSHNIACSDTLGATWTDCHNGGGLSITVDPANSQHVIAAIYDDLGETTNGFGAFSTGLRAPGMDAAIVDYIHYRPSGELFAATDRGIFYTPVGSSGFQARLDGLDAWDIDAISQDGDDMWVSTRGGPLHSVRGQPFTIGTAGITGNTTVRHVRAMADGRVIAGGRNLYISSDRGDTWTQLYMANAVDGYYAADIAFNGTRMFVATGTRLLWSDPPYASFTPVAFPGGNHPGDVLLMTASGLWIGTDDGLHVSKDNGATISPIPDIGSRVVRTIRELADGRIIIGTQDGAWISDAAFTTFTRAGLSGIYVDGLTLNGTTFIAATAVGVLYTRDNGMSWTPVPGAENIPSSATIVDDTTGQLIVGTDSRGLIRVPLP